jgi:hypothetical protein
VTPIDGKGREQGPQDIVDPEDFIDPKGYWSDSERNIRRTSGEQEIVLKATDACTKAEWRMRVLLDCGLLTQQLPAFFVLALHAPR